MPQRSLSHHGHPVFLRLCGRLAGRDRAAADDTLHRAIGDQVTSARIEPCHTEIAFRAGEIKAGGADIREIDEINLTGPREAELRVVVLRVADEGVGAARKWARCDPGARSPRGGRRGGETFTAATLNPVCADSLASGECTQNKALHHLENDPGVIGLPRERPNFPELGIEARGMQSLQSSTLTARTR